MQKLEGNIAAQYLSRLNGVMSLDKKESFADSQAALLSVLLSVEHAFVKYHSGDLIITASGFPTLPTTLAHVQEALTKYRKKVNDKRAATSKWLEAIAKLSVESAVQLDIDIDQTSPQLARIVSKLSADQIKYLDFVSQPSTRTKLPIETSDKFPSLLISLPVGTPFREVRPDRSKERVKYFRKYIDSPTYTSPNTPKNSQDRHSRTPVILFGYLDNHGNPVYYAAFSPNVKVSHKTTPSKTARQVEKIMKLDSSLPQVFLNLDLAGLSDKNVDALLAALPEIDSLAKKIASTAQHLSSDKEAQSPKNRQELVKQFAQRLYSIEDSAARLTIQTAVARSLMSTKVAIDSLPT